MISDLSFLNQKLMTKEGLSLEEAYSAVAEYDAFIAQFIGSDGPFRPSVVADLAWHAHLEEEEHYAEFCMKYIGRYVHHVPDKIKDLGHCAGSAGCSGQAF